MRRTWIEIITGYDREGQAIVVLHAEDVDWNAAG